MTEKNTIDKADFNTPEEALAYLKTLGTQEDKDIDIVEGALAAGLVFLPGVNVDRYRQHIHKMYKALTPQEGVQNRIADINRILYEENEYTGDDDSYYDIENVNLVRTIERHKGIHITLGILYIALARHQGWDCDGLSFPGRFLVRLEQDGERVIVDPFHQGETMEAPDLRKLLKSILGSNAELSHEFYNFLSNRDILLRLQNLMKKRFIDNEDYTSAIIAAESIEAFYPEEYHIHLDKGVLYAKLENATLAVESLETYKEKTPIVEEKFQADMLIQQIKSSLG